MYKNKFRKIRAEFSQEEDLQIWFKECKNSNAHKIVRSFI